MFLIVDGSSLTYRAFYAVPLLTNSKGEPTNAVLGFCNMLLKTIAEVNPNKIAVCFDKKRQTFRNDLFADYKAQRKMTPAELKPQFGSVKKLLAALGICCLEADGFEADDLIGSLVESFPDEQKIVISGDRDVLQLVSYSTAVYFTKRGVSDIEVFDQVSFRKAYDFYPKLIADYKALTGDTSDNIPGIKGIGKKTALQLVSQYGSLENIYANLDKLSKSVQTKLAENKKEAFDFRILATIVRDCPIEGTFKVEPVWQDIENLCREFEFKNFISKLKAHPYFSSRIAPDDPVEPAQLSLF